MSLFSTMIKIQIISLGEQRMYSQLKWGGGKRLQGDVVGMLSLEEETFGKTGNITGEGRKH